MKTKHISIASIYYILVMFLGATLSLAFPPNALNCFVFPSMIIFILGLEIHKNKSGKLNFCYGYLFYLGAVIAFIGSWFSYYFRLQLGCGYLLSYTFTMIVCLYTSLYIGIICVIYNKFKTQYRLFNLVIFFPSLWVLTELIRGQFFPRSWYALGYTQVDNFLFRGYFPLLGVYFVSWLVVAIAGFLVYCILEFKSNTVLTKVLIRKLLIYGGSAISFVLISNVLASIHYTKKFGQPITVALLQPSIFSSKHYNYDTLLDIEDTTAQLIKQSRAADLIVLPETVFGTFYGNLTPGYLDDMNQYLHRKKQVLIFSTPLRDANNMRTTGVVDSRYLEVPVYRKHHLVPFGEYNPIKETILAPLVKSFSQQISNYVPGSVSQEAATILGQRFAFNICYENTVNDYVANNAKSATILINQSDLSWYGKTKMKDAFLQFSQGRALENQRYFLQDGNTGDTAVINPHGVIEKRIPAFATGGLVASIQGYSGITLFQQVGNTPMWILCFGVLLLVIIIKKF